MPEKGKPIQTLIVDDESPARKRIRELVKECPDFYVSGECSNGAEAVERINDGHLDVVFLDIQLQDMSGFDVLEKVRADRLPLIVFVTAFDSYALQAFDVHAVDYLLKPFDDERFEEMLGQIRKMFRQNQMNDLGGKLDELLSDYERIRIQGESSVSNRSFQERLVLRSIGKVSFIVVDDIDWIGAEGYYVNLSVNGKSHLMRETIKNLENTLDPGKFLRIHRSTIVNISRIKELQPSFHGDYVVILKDGKKLKLSRSYRGQMDKLLKNP